MAKIVGKPSADDVKRVAVAALVAALDDGKDQARKKPGLTGMRAVATGAVLYTAGKAAFSGRRFINERLRSDEDDAEYDDEEDLEEDLEEDEEEPVAEEEEDFQDEDDDFEEEEELEEDDEERSAASEPPVHPDEDDIDESDLPERPSRKRAPVGRR